MRLVTEDGAEIGGVDVLDGFLEKVRGLMFRDEGRVMLAFSRSDRHAVWMPFMRFALDIAFLDAEKRVVHVEEDVPPVSLAPSTWRIYRPSRPCRYVLEVEAGLFEENGVGVGTEFVV